MRYLDNREQSAELLRMVLPLMSRHLAGFHPLSYAIWYEYSAGLNQPLRAAIDQLTAGGALLDDAAVRELFDKYVAMRDIESTAELRLRIQEVVADVDEAATQAGEEVGRYNEGLGEAQRRMREPLDPQGVAAMIDGLMGDTARVLDRTSQLHASLVASAQEARQLGEELDTQRGQAQLDPLTGLATRKAFESLLGDDPSAGALLVLEVERLAALAGQFGHLIVDRALAAVAQVIASTVGHNARAARLGSAQFAVLVPGASPQVAQELADRIGAAVAQCRVRRQDSDDSIEALSVTCGVTQRPAAEPAAALLERGEAALADARGMGAGAVATRGSPDAGPG